MLRLAVRNLRRNKRRTALTVSSLVAGIGLLILGFAFIDGLSEGIFVAAEDGLVGHLLARPAGYPAQGFQHPVDDLLDVSPAARAFLDRETSGWTGRLIFSPLAVHGADSFRVRAIGFQPGRDETVFSRALWTVRGSHPDPAKAEVLVGRGVARLLRVAPGDRLVLQCRTHRGVINALDVTVSGLVVTNNSAIDGTGILLPMPLAAKLVNADRPTHLSVRLASRDRAEAFRPKLAAALGPRAEIVTWEDETRDLMQLQAIRRRALLLVVGILLALAGFGTANTILMAAHERVREIGTLRSLGMTEGDVRKLFLAEGGLLGVVGGGLGVAWGSLLALRWAAHPMDLGSAMEGQVRGDLAVSALIYTQWDPAIAAGAFVFGVVVAVLSSIYPSRVAAGMVPADAVRAEG